MALSESQSDPQPHDHNPNQHNFDHLNAILPQPAHSVVVPESANMRACRRIQVSREKRPLHFYVTLSRKFLQTDEMVELSGLGLAVTTVVTVAEILKSQGLVHLESKFSVPFQCISTPHYQAAS